MPNYVPHLLRDFDKSFDLYRSFTDRVQKLLEQLLSENSVVIHSVTARTKDRSSFERKVSRAEANYPHLSSVTDISGVRVITYFDDQVDAVAQLVQREFNISWDNSVDKRATLDPDRFGYLSVHYVAALSNDRQRLTEYRRFPGLFIEIQIRSILQHAWAEIEHDLGYKSKAAIPAVVRRRFSRLAGLLELADFEFKGIRDALREHESSVSVEVIRSPDEVALDGVSLRLFLQSGGSPQSISERIARTVGAELIADAESGTDFYVDMLSYIGFATIGEIDAALKAHEEHIVQFASRWLKNAKRLHSSIALGYLAYVVLGSRGGLDAIEAFFEHVRIGSGEARLELAKNILNTYLEITTAP
jgi:ppGpp synthetase/RelA/SpoT-type nucleotidyltranferase